MTTSTDSLSLQARKPTPGKKHRAGGPYDFSSFKAAVSLLAKARPCSLPVAVIGYPSMCFGPGFPSPLSAVRGSIRKHSTRVAADRIFRAASGRPFFFDFSPPGEDVGNTKTKN